MKCRWCFQEISKRCVNHPEDWTTKDWRSVFADGMTHECTGNNVGGHEPFDEVDLLFMKVTGLQPSRKEV